MKTARAPAGTDDAPPLVFEWEGRPRARLRLVALVAFSLLIHAASFYVLQVAYTPTGSQLPPPVQVTMLRSERPDDPPEIRAQARSLARWLTINDPSLTTQPAVSEADRPPGGYVHYVPSYKGASPPFKPLDPPSAGTAAPPRPRPPGPVPVPSRVENAKTLTPSPPTRVVFTGGIAPLAPAPLPGIAYALPASSGKTLGATVFLVGVRSGGGEPFLFREASSGEVTADDFAQDYLSGLRFQPPGSADNAMAWGWAEFNWGREVYR